MTEEKLSQRGKAVVRRLILEPGEAMAWHRDPFHRMTVVVRGEALEIQFRDGGEPVRVPVSAGRIGMHPPIACTAR